MSGTPEVQPVTCNHVDILDVTTLSSAEFEGVCSNCSAGFLADRNGGPWVRSDLPELDGMTQ